MNIEILYLTFEDGKCPYLEWEAKLDKFIRSEVRIRINRVRIGNFGDCESIEGARNLRELRMDLGPGYRIYFGKLKDTLVIFLCGGDKKSQDRDIKKAKEYWQLYKDSLKKNRKHG